MPFNPQSFVRNNDADAASAAQKDYILLLHEEVGAGSTFNFWLEDNSRRLIGREVNNIHLLTSPEASKIIKALKKLREQR